MSIKLSPRVLCCALAASAVVSLHVRAQTPLGTAFTYQGHLNDGGSPANGDFDMVFTLWNDPALSAPANQIGPTLTFDGVGGNPPPVGVTNGLFTVQLDFGAAYNGDKRWLEIGVSGITLSPRQELTAVPYALRALDAPSAGGYWSASGSDISNTNTGNVGIGTSAPTQRLHVADSTGPASVRVEGYVTLSPSPMRSPTSASSTTWSDPQNVLASDNLYATTMAGACETIATSSHGFSLPSSAVVTGIVVRIERHATTAFSGDCSVMLLGGAGASENKASPDPWPTTETIAVYGAANDLWGLSWMPAEINSAAFGVELSAGAALGTARVDHIQIEVFYTATESAQGEVALKNTGLELSVQSSPVLTLTPDGEANIAGNANISNELYAGRIGIGLVNTQGFSLAVNGTAAKPGGGSWSALSDARLKTDIKPLSGTLDRLLSLQGYEFQYTDEALSRKMALPGRQIGLLAQEVQRIFPDWVGRGDDGYLFVTERGTTALMIEALRDLRAEKDKQIAQLRAENADLKARLERLELMMLESVENSKGSLR